MLPDEFPRGCLALVRGGFRDRIFRNCCLGIVGGLACMGEDEEGERSRGYGDNDDSSRVRWGYKRGCYPYEKANTSNDDGKD